MPPLPPDDFDRRIATRLRLGRKLRDRSQGELAEALGLVFQQVQKLERGLTRLKAGQLWRAAIFLDLPLLFFFEDATADAPITMATKGRAVAPMPPAEHDPKRLPGAVDLVVARQLKAARSADEATLASVADAIGVSLQQLSKIERGENRITAAQLSRAAGALNRPLLYFFEGLQPAPPLTLDPADLSRAAGLDGVSKRPKRAAGQPLLGTLAPARPLKLGG